MEATLIQASVSGSSNNLRTSEPSSSGSAMAHRNAWESNNSRLFSNQVLHGNGFLPARQELHQSSGGTQLPLSFVFEGNDPSNGMTVPGDDDFFTPVGLIHGLGQEGLGIGKAVLS